MKQVKIIINIQHIDALKNAIQELNEEKESYRLEEVDSRDNGNTYFITLRVSGPEDLIPARMFTLGGLTNTFMQL